MNTRAINQPQIRFIKQRGSLQYVAQHLPPHLLMREPVQLVINQRHQSFQRRLVILAPILQEFGYFVCHRGH